MAKNIHRLKALQIKHLTDPGWYPDGRGLYLQVSKTGTKSWVYRYEIDGQERRQGLGSLLDVSLEEARKAASNSRQLRTSGIDPIDHKHQLQESRQLEAAKGMTFKECATSYIDSHKAGWKNSKHESQWRNTLETYAYPSIGSLPIQIVDVGLVMQILEPIWYEKTETASRVRQRIENVLDWAKARGYRTGENPALWRGHLDKLLPKRAKVQKVKHLNAMPYAELPEYFIELRKRETLAAKALAFAILTATRSNEAREARWSEIDVKKGIWIIPEARMKAGREHRVPLTPECMSILKVIKPDKTNDFVFPGLGKDTSISDAALLKSLKQTHPTLTVHGFRSSFRDWCAEMTNYPRELAEAALAHALKDQTEAAYQRGDMFDKRRKLMYSWADYCLTGKKTSKKVAPINKAVS
jgi:integrase